jgi:hypothetical protein
MFTDIQKFTAEKTTAVFQGKNITVTHFTPVLSPEERARRKLEIERRLYGIFKKYQVET